MKQAEMQRTEKGKTVDGATLQAEIQKAIGGRMDSTLFRNTVGEGWQGRRVYPKGLPTGVVALRNPRYVTFGLTPGSPDLVGWHSFVIKPEHVGRKVAAFLVVEVKGDGDTVKTNQSRFLNAVATAGGLSCAAWAVEDALSILINKSE